MCVCVYGDIIYTEFKNKAVFNFCADACWFVLTELSCSVFKCHILILTMKFQCKLNSEMSQINLMKHLLPRAQWHSVSHLKSCTPVNCRSANLV